MIALVLPPLTQLNAPYPGPAYLARALRDAGVPHTQRDLGIEWILRLYSRAGLTEIFDALEERDELPDPAWRALALRDQHLAAIEPVVAFLQGRDRAVGPRILRTPMLPRGPRLAAADLDGFGPLAVDDAARHLATLYLSDLADLVTSCIDPGFSLIRYQHHLAVGPAPFDPLARRLAETTILDAWLDSLADTLTAPIVAISVPFPGNLYGALRIGRRVRTRGGRVILGGGYVNTELRTVSEPRLWDYVDALSLDDGEAPLLGWLSWVTGGPDRRVRTTTGPGVSPLPGPPIETPAAPPTSVAAWYGDLPLGHYLQLVDSVNPAHRLWSDGRWNKITVAHGCYWRRCSFCDIQLDYIARYAPAKAEALVDAMDELVAATGQSGFHLVDEAAPPRGLRDLALELLHRGRAYTFWGNIRFEEAFTPDLCRLLAAAGMVTATGGLEVASDRLLARMEKGVTIEQVARAADAFSRAGIGVHAYLMYGFPGQTEEETVDSLEIVRQLFAAGVVRSAFWHRFVFTRHSGMARDPARYGVVIPPLDPGSFADNDVPHLDPDGADHDRFDAPLPAALAAWMRGRQLDRPAHDWIVGASPSREDPRRIECALRRPIVEPRPDAHLVWLGGGVSGGRGKLVLDTVTEQVVLRARRDDADWLAEVIDAARPRAGLSWADARAAFPGDWERFEPTFAAARKAGLVLV